MNHTPGPWFHARETITYDGGFTQTFGGDIVFASDRETAICMISGMYINKTLEELKTYEQCKEGLANARLIAAAPELLAALIIMVKATKDGDMTSDFIEEAEDAIAKATTVQS